MKYVNDKTGLEIDLGELSEKKKKFYEKALEKFQKNIDWLEFDDFAFNYRSPVFKAKNVLSSPLYRAMCDMSMQLGVQQGKIKR